MSIPEQPFGFVAGRWVLSLADTPMDSDRAPDYKPLYPGSVIFNNKLSHRVVTDGSETVGIVKTRYEANLNEEGRIIDAEEHEFVALPVGVYSVTFSFGQYSWPNFDIEVKAEHTIDSPLWLPSKSPIPAGPGIVHVVSEEARLAAEAAAASAWEAVDTPGRQGPQGIQGPPGDLDPEHLAGAPRLTNLVHDITWDAAGGASIESQTPRLIKFEATAQNGQIRFRDLMVPGAIYYYTAEVKTTSDQVFFGSSQAPVYHSGSGDLERLTGRVAPSSVAYFQVRDTRQSGWDQIEIRDPVLINLTAVFGAGREPSKEYMEALLAKHGHYIGAVDQFAVGDALQALTVAGPGMSVRVDNTVGTRVLLDHPGGTTMLHGDTGWRDITSLLTGFAPTNTGTVTISRTGNTTALKLTLVLLAPGTGPLFMGIIPSGFRQGTSRIAAVGGFRTPRPATTQNYFLNDNNLFWSSELDMSTGVTSTVRPDQTVSGLITFRTDNAWPPTLPGIPV